MIESWKTRKYADKLIIVANPESSEKHTTGIVIEHQSLKKRNQK